MIFLLFVRLISHTEKLLRDGEEKLVVQVLTTLQGTVEVFPETTEGVRIGESFKYRKYKEVMLCCRAKLFAMPC